MQQQGHSLIDFLPTRIVLYLLKMASDLSKAFIAARGAIRYTTKRWHIQHSSVNKVSSAHPRKSEGSQFDARTRMERSAMP